MKDVAVEINAENLELTRAFDSLLTFSGSSAESVGESRATWGLCHLSLLK